MELTRIGLWASPRTIGAEDLPEAARVAEWLGFGALWVGGSPRLPALAPMLAATERIVIATGIVNVWAYEPAQLASEHAELSSRHPGRLLTGIGIGHPEATEQYARPLSTMRGFLDGVAGAPAPIPREEMCLAALGPKMLELSAERTLGAHPYFTPPAHTRFAREHVGPERLVAPELACVLDDDAERARGTAREYATFYLSLRNYRSNLLRFGFEEADVADGGSDALVDTIVPQGDAERIAAAADEHLAAGADHVCVQALGGGGVPERAWSELASVLIA